MSLQAVLVSAVWGAVVLAADLPVAMIGPGVVVAVLLAWRDHRHDEMPDRFEDEATVIERDPSPWMWQ